MNLDIYFEFVTRKGTSFVWETSDHGWTFTVTILSLGRPTGVPKNTRTPRQQHSPKPSTLSYWNWICHVASGSLF